MAEAERKATSEHLMDRYRHDLERVQADLGTVLRHHLPTAGYPLVVHALVETCGTLAGLLVLEEPTRRAVLLARLDELRLYVATAGQAAQ